VEKLGDGLMVWESLLKGDAEGDKAGEGGELNEGEGEGEEAGDGESELVRVLVR